MIFMNEVAKQAPWAESCWGREEAASSCSFANPSVKIPVLHHDRKC
jgi:hypothetical protein